jgi:uncharacterized membrane protein
MGTWSGVRSYWRPLRTTGVLIIVMCEIETIVISISGLLCVIGLIFAYIKKSPDCPDVTIKSKCCTQGNGT